MSYFNIIFVILLSILLIVTTIIGEGVIVILLGLSLAQQVRIISISNIERIQEQIIEAQSVRIQTLKNNENKND